jgi:hypothetical protein
MFYVNFEEHITNKYGIIVVNWPISKFVAPGSIGTRLELETLHHAWSSGATYFRRLNADECAAWKAQRFSTAVTGALPNSSYVKNTAVATGPSTSQIAYSASTTFSGTEETSQNGSNDVHCPTVAGELSTHTALPSARSNEPLTSNEPQEPVIFSVIGMSLVTRKARKERSDKGKKRGPRSKGSESNTSPMV